MRVIAGSAKRRLLKSAGEPEMQPTMERVKEAVFSKLHFELEGRRALDLFAGSGQLGIEALSRGAAHCDFVDNSKESLDCVKKNIGICGFAERARVHGTNAFTFIKSAEQDYDVVFLDPPFHHGILEKILPLTAAHVKKNGVIYCETDDKERLPQTAGDFVLDSQAVYGTIKTTFYRHKEYREEVL